MRNLTWAVIADDPEEEPGDGGSPGPDTDDGQGGNPPTGC
jgi:hypothetical protein